jgi:hypothetical protein
MFVKINTFLIHKTLAVEKSSAKIWAVSVIWKKSLGTK